MYYDGAYGPFGELYAQTGATDVSFTGMNQDTVANLYDFPDWGVNSSTPRPAKGWRSNNVTATAVGVATVGTGVLIWHILEGVALGAAAF
ncbi:MAG: hypothetical protein WA737_16275 [Candidatus Acidiferrales bacterium]